MSNHFLQTTGETDPVWTHLMPYSAYPSFPALTSDLETEICIVGSGIAGISIAYELVTRGLTVTMLEARNVLSGESGRTSGHLTNALDDGYRAIADKHGSQGAKVAADSHGWAIARVDEIVAKLGLDCEFRHLPAYELSQYPVGHKRHDAEIAEIKAEVGKAAELGMDVVYRDLEVKGWDGDVDQRGGAVWANQATFHPTRYLVGVLKWLQQQSNFRCFTHTRVVDIAETRSGRFGFGSTEVKIHTDAGPVVTADFAVQATCVPLQKMSVIAEMSYNRTYCIAVRVPKGRVEDCLIYDQAEAYKYVRLTRCDENNDYLVVGGCDHKVGQEETAGRFEELETWTRERFACAGGVDYRWSGQIYEPVDYMGFIGKNQGQSNVFVVTGDSGDGLTHGVLASQLVADQIQGVYNPWSKLYDPSRVASVVKSLRSMLGHDLQINTQYKRYLQTDIDDIEDLGRDEGAVLNSRTSKPVAVYKDESGQVHRYSAMCTHMKGVVCWNKTEKSWDCPVHGSRFSKHGLCVQGPATVNLDAVDEPAHHSQEAEQVNH